MRSPPGLEPKAVISLTRPREAVREGTAAAGSHAESNADALRVARCKPCMAVGALRADITGSPFGNGGAPRSELGGLSSSTPKAVAFAEHIRCAVLWDGAGLGCPTRPSAMLRARLGYFETALPDAKAGRSTGPEIHPRTDASSFEG